MLWGAGIILLRAVRVAWGISGPALRSPLAWTAGIRPSFGPRARTGLAAVLVAALVTGGTFTATVHAPPPTGSIRVSAVSLDPPQTAYVAGPDVRAAGPSVNRGLPPVFVPTGQRNALLIGINHAPGAPTLPGSVQDAQNVHDALLRYGFESKNVTMLLETSATRAAILSQIDSLAARTPSNGIAVFAVASHTRRTGSLNELLTADGLRISASELAAHLGRIPAPTWIALPTCYAGGYALPGIVGPNRVATFASPSSEETFQLGSEGSYLIINMVRKAMIEGEAPWSVEAAFQYAKDTLQRSAPNRVPLMSDGIPGGNLVLGPAPWAKRYQWNSDHAHDYQRSDTGIPQNPDVQDPSRGGPTQQPQPTPSHGPSVRVCGRYQYHCDN